MENTTPNTDNFLNWVEIKNFKSIKDLRLDCKRVNVFIGKPNVGKSNILEGLGLLGAGNFSRYFDGLIRYRHLKDLFYDFDSTLEIQVASEDIKAILRENESFKMDDITYDLSWKSGTYPVNKFFLNEQGNFVGSTIEVTMEEGPIKVDPPDVEFQDTVFGYDPLKKYDFANLTNFENLFQKFLLPPNGSNLYSVVRRNRELWAEFAKLFTEQQLELVLYDEKQEFILQKKNGPFVTQYPFFSIADTFRRFMFYITAIESNKNSVIIFEEPEVHSFPPYVKAMAHRIVDSEENQFFISTHSPYLLQTLIRELDESQLSVFITYYKDYQTCVRQLTTDELQEAEDLSIDLFYNLSRYEPNA